MSKKINKGNDKVIPIKPQESSKSVSVSVSMPQAAGGGTG